MLSLSFLLIQLAQDHGWTPWIPLQGSWTSLKKEAGLYRIRLETDADWLYLGQTSNLHNRVQMLKGVFGSAMPYAAPHTAGPGLYAYRHLYPQATLQVSVLPLDVSESHRLALESFAIAQHRQRYQHSPRCQFGRMPPGWRASSGNSAHLIAHGKRFRGGPTEVVDESHLPDIAPFGSLSVGAPCSMTWLNLSWSPWVTGEDAVATCGAQTEGLYRISAAQEREQLLFIGQGKLAQRLAPYKRQEVRCSWVAGTWVPTSTPRARHRLYRLVSPPHQQRPTVAIPGQKQAAGTNHYASTPDPVPLLIRLDLPLTLLEMEAG